MTKPRDPASIEAAVLEVIRILGADEAGKIIGRNAQSVRDYSDAERPGNVTLAHAMLLDAACIHAGRESPFFDRYKEFIDASIKHAGKLVA